MNNTLKIPWTNIKYLDDLMIEVKRFSNNHRAIPEIHVLAFNFLVEKEIPEFLAKDAAEAIAKARRSELDLINIKTAVNFLRNQK